MVVREREVESSYTPVWLACGDQIVQIGGPDPKKKWQATMYTGVQILEPEFLSYLPDHRESCVIRDGYQAALARGEKIYSYVYSGYWNDLGTLDRYRAAENELSSGRVKLSFL